MAPSPRGLSAKLTGGVKGAVSEADWKLTGGVLFEGAGAQRMRENKHKGLFSVFVFRHTEQSLVLLNGYPASKVLEPHVFNDYFFTSL